MKSRSWPNGSTTAWRKTRRHVLQRDGSELDDKDRIITPGPCMLRIPGVCTHWATCVHHTADRLIVGDDPAYLIAACRACNNRVGDPTRPGKRLDAASHYIHTDLYNL